MYRYMFISLLLSLQLFAADIDSNGFIRHWLILGPYSQDGYNDPGTSVQAEDYLTDGTITQDNIAPFAGMIVDTDYSIAQSTGLIDTGDDQLNPTGKPQWFEYTSPSSTIDFNTVYVIDVNEAMSYACCYVKNLTGDTIQNLHFAMGSDDGIQAYLGEQDIWNNSVARGFGGDTQIQDRSPAFDLPAGITRILVKNFEGGGGWGFRLRFEDDNNQPVGSNDLEVTLLPYGPCPESIGIFGDSWLREVTFSWENHFSNIEIWEDGSPVATIPEPMTDTLTLSDVSLGEHNYEFRTEIGSDEPPCDPVNCFVELTPVWPVDFHGSEIDTGLILLQWRNLEPYYDILKIQENNADVIGVFYDRESAQVSGLSPGTHTFTLVVELSGYKSQDITCQVEITGPPQEFIRGDANSDGNVDLADAINILQYLFSNGEISACPDTSDINDDGQIDLSDPITALLYLFSNGSIPAPGADTCGPDPTSDTLVRCQYDSGLCGN